jgi:hypothetical protein
MAVTARMSIWGREVKQSLLHCTYERAQALLHAERAGATTQTTSERLTTTAIYAATK